MSNYISKIEQNGIEYAIRDESTLGIFNNEVLMNGVLMPSFKNALAAAAGNVEIKLMSNVVLNAPVILPAGAHITLDLNGHTIKPTADLTYSGGLITVVHGSSLTINGEGTVGGYANGLYAPLMLTTKDTINDIEPANLTINGGTYVGYYYCICGNGNPGRGNSHIVINDGEFRTISFDGTVIYNPQENSTVVINGGRLIGGNTGIEMRSGDLTVNGGFIECLNAPSSVTPNGNGTTSCGSAIAINQHTTCNPLSATINGGIFKGFHALNQSNPQGNNEEAIALVNLTINNGSFVTEYGSTLSIYSENKTGFINGGHFYPEAKAEYFA